MSNKKDVLDALKIISAGGKVSKDSPVLQGKDMERSEKQNDVVVRAIRGKDMRFTKDNDEQ